MTPADRFKDWIDGLAESWKDRLRGWMASWLGFGIEVFFDVLGKAAAPKLKPFIDTLEKTGRVPPELQPILDELKTPKGEAAAMFANSVGGGLIGGALGRLGDALFGNIASEMNRMNPTVPPGLSQAIDLWRRGTIDDAQLEDLMLVLGIPKETHEWYRELAKFLPSPMDLVSWQAREVFEPEMISKYGLDDEFEALRHEDFRKVGVTPEHELNFWRAHWEHASWNQMVEMLHRGLVTEDDVWEWFRLVEITPYWRDKLIKSAYNVPTRVDVRRFYDLKTIDEARLREIYAAQGYHGKDLDDYVLWTKIYVDLPDLLARWKNGWITLDDVRTGLISAGMKSEAADELIQTKVKSVEPASTAEGKELTKSEIYKGVKQGVISYNEGLDLIMDLDYTKDQADYLLITNVQALTGSPETYMDFKDMTQKYRKAAGLETKPVTEELKAAAAEVVKLTRDVKSLSDTLEAEERTLIKQEVLPGEATAKRDELRVALHRAESALAAAKSHYDSLVAEWRHKGEV
uniref:Uncharacterized protein n=1 Tax=viral metagenome TaxID=1070528 RepID=A0A6M3JYI5_9ZZZZ